MLMRAIAGLLALFGASVAHAEWREAQTAHFIIRSDEAERSLIERAQQLEVLHWLMRTTTGADDSANGQRVRIYVVPTTITLRRAMGETGPSNTAAGFYRTGREGPIGVIARDQGALGNTLLQHEYAHHFMLQYMRGHFPPWYVEGFAELVGSSTFDRPGEVAFGRAPPHRQGSLWYGDWTPLATMFAPRDPADRRAGNASYGQYWLVTHYLTFDQSRRGQLADYLSRLARGETTAQAAAAFPGGLEALDRDARAYLHANSFRYQNVPIPAAAQVTPTIRTLGRDEVDLMPVLFQVERPRPVAEMAEVVARTAELAARYPTSAPVARAHALALLSAQRWTEAEQAADATLALAPDDVRALTYKGLAQLQRIGATGGDAAKMASARAARQFIIRANRRDPEDAVPLFAYWDSFRLTGETPTDSALDGFAKATDLQPTAVGRKLELARAFIQRRRFAEARPVLEPIAYSPHRSGAQAAALAMLRWIEGGAATPPPSPNTPISGDDNGEAPAPAA